MTAFLILVAVLGTIFGIGTFASAKSAIHEIAAYLCFLLTLISIIAIALLDRLDGIKKALEGKDPVKPKQSAADKEGQKSLATQSGNNG